MKRNLKINFPENVGAKHINAISLGVGVQSSTLLVMADRGEITPRPDLAIFADTQNEPKAVYLYLQYLKSIVRNIPIHVISVGDLAAEALRLHTHKKTGGKYTRRYLPVFMRDRSGLVGNMQSRGCTIDFKIKPINKYLRKLAAVSYGQEWIGVTTWLGISTDEASRMRDSRHAWLAHRYPLIEKNFSRQDCLEYFGAKKLQPPPRSACIFCPFHSPLEWQKMKTEQPAEFQEAVKFERMMQNTFNRTRFITGTPYLTKYAEPLDEIDFEKFLTDKKNNFQNECTGMCGV